MNALLAHMNSTATAHFLRTLRPSSTLPASASGRMNVIQNRQPYVKLYLGKLCSGVVRCKRHQVAKQITALR